MRLPSLLRRTPFRLTLLFLALLVVTLLGMAGAPILVPIVALSQFSELGLHRDYVLLPSGMTQQQNKIVPS